MGTDNTEIVLVYFIGTIGMVLLAGAIFFFFVTYQKRLLRKQLELNQVKSDQKDEILRNTIYAQEKERKRIAQDLHDEVGAMLSVVKLNVARIEKKTSEQKPKELAGETKTYLDDVIMQVRRISRDLLPPALERFGLYYAIEELAKWVNKSDQILIQCKLSGEQSRFESKKELALFRIVQELLNNAIKHAEASAIYINVRFTSSYLAIAFSDNGKGFDVEEKKNEGLGLKNFESRTQILDARFKLWSRLQKGTTAFILLKLMEEVE